MLEAVVEPAPQMGDPVGRRLDDDDHVVAVDLDRVGAHVVGEGVEGAARVQVEAGVVPVAGEQAVVDGAPVQRETHVRAAVVDRVGAALGPEHADRLRPELGRQLSLGHQLVAAAHADTVLAVHGDSSGFRLPWQLSWEGTTSSALEVKEGRRRGDAPTWAPGCGGAGGGSGRGADRARGAGRRRRRVPAAHDWTGRADFGLEYIPQM